MSKNKQNWPRYNQSWHSYNPDILYHKRCTSAIFINA